MKKCTSLEEQKGTRYIQENFFLALLSLRFLLNCLVLEIKGIYQSSLGNEVDFRGMMNFSPNILPYNFKKMRHDFVDERALITMTLISYCQWKTLVPFFLRKKRPENLFLTLIANYRKIVQKKNLIGYLMMHDV